MRGGRSRLSGAHRHLVRALRSPRPALPDGLGKLLGADELAAGQGVSKVIGVGKRSLGTRSCTKLGKEADSLFGIGLWPW